MRFFPAIVIGVIVGVALGYAVYKLGGDYDAYFWAISGAIVAAAISIMWRKNSK